MINIRKMRNGRLRNLEIRLINKRRFYCLFMPVAQKIIFRRLPMRTTGIFCICMMVPGNNIMKVLLGCNTQDKQQEEDCCYNAFLGFASVQV